jgi:hypothetical protein
MIEDSKRAVGCARIAVQSAAVFIFLEKCRLIFHLLFGVLVDFIDSDQSIVV